MDEHDFGASDRSEGRAETPSAAYDIVVDVTAVLGRSTMPIAQILKLGRGAVVELERRLGDTIELYVKDCLVARGEVVVVEDKLAVTLTEVVMSDRGR